LAWRVEVTRSAEKQIAKLDRQTQISIIHYLKEHLEQSEDPRQQGKALRGEKKGLWRYRVGDYRVICHIRDESKTVVVLTLGHRKEVYR
jgi:mRNA interferase RelE/StbE